MMKGPNFRFVKGPLFPVEPFSEDGLRFEDTIEGKEFQEWLEEMKSQDTGVVSDELPVAIDVTRKKYFKILCPHCGK